MTTLARSTRYLEVGVWAVYWLPTVADYTAVLRTEITAGTNITGEIAALSGFTTTGNPLPTPDGGSLFTSSVPGLISAADSSINFWGDKTGADARTLFTLGDTGAILFMDGGDVPTTGKMDVFPVAIQSRDLVRSLTEPLQVAVSFTITDQPDYDQAIPATGT